MIASREMGWSPNAKFPVALSSSENQGISPISTKGLKSRPFDPVASFLKSPASFLLTLSTMNEEQRK
jgi:hypothetical protein